MANFFQATHLRVVFIALLCLNLISCAAWETVTDFTTSLLGGEDNAEPPNELVDYPPEIEIATLWEEDIGDGYEDHVVKLVPAIDAEHIFAADREGVIEARDINSGDVIWEIETELPLSSGPGLGDASLIVGSSSADVLAINKETGENLWHVQVSSEVLSVPKIAEGIVIVRTVDGKVFALSEETGEEQWVFERGIPALSIRGASTPVVVDEKIINGYANGKAIALRLKDGKQLWETSVAIPSGRSEVERLVDLVTDPVETQGVVFIAAYQGGTSALLAEDGEVLWRADEISSYAGFALDWQYLYVTDTASDIWQLDLRNGAGLWKQKELHRRALTAPVVYDEYVVVADFEGYVHWLSSTDGRQLGRIQVTDSPVIVPPLVVGDIVYVYAKDGTLSALKIESHLEVESQ